MQGIKTISGILSCYIFKWGNKKYILFGDRHFTRKGNCKEQGYLCDHFDGTFENTYSYGSDCTTIGALLHNWLTYNNDHNIKTDFYLETIYTKNDRYHDQEYVNIINNRKINKYHKNNDNNAPFKDKSWLQIMSYIMNPCFIREKTECPYYPNVHSHYIDVRLMDTKDGVISINPFSLSLLYQVNDVLKYIYILIKEYKQILNSFLSPYGFTQFVNNTEIPENIREEFINNIALFTVFREINGKKIQMYKAAWELYRLKLINPTMAVNITNYMYNSADYIINQIFIKFNNDITAGNIDRTYYIKEYSKLFVDMESILMDSYALARIFIQEETNEIIIYAGNYHIQVYVDFFNQLQYPLLISGTGENCITIPNLPFYLDANKYRKYVTKKQNQNKIAIF